MELVRDNIKAGCIKCKNEIQMTVENDVNIRDNNPDIKRVICEEARLVITEKDIVSERLFIKGKLVFCILYETADGQKEVSSMEGEIWFDDSVSLNDVSENDVIHIKGEVLDLVAEIINSRKINIKSVIRLMITVNDCVDREYIVNGPHMEQLFVDKEVSELVINQKDLVRVKGDIPLSSGKDSVANIMYKTAELEDVNIRVKENKLVIGGMLKVFVMYQGDTDGRLNDYEGGLVFEKELELSNVNDEMIPYVAADLWEWSIVVRADDDMEERILDIEATIMLNIKIFEDRKLHILKDMYSVKNNVKVSYKDTAFYNIAIRNNSMVTITDTLVLPKGQPPIMQICHGKGYVKIDEKEITEKGIKVIGIIEVLVLYYTLTDGSQIECFKGAIPFDYVIEVENLTGDYEYELNTSLNNISITVNVAEEIEVKAGVCNDLIVLEKKVITHVSDGEVENELLMAEKGIFGYVVKPEDDLWSIAKHYKTTRERIKSVNNVTEVLTGDKILIY